MDKAKIFYNKIFEKRSRRNPKWEELSETERLWWFNKVRQLEYKEPAPTPLNKETTE